MLYWAQRRWAVALARRSASGHHSCRHLIRLAAAILPALSILQRLECKQDRKIRSKVGQSIKCEAETKTGTAQAILLLSFSLNPLSMSAGKVWPFSQISTSFLIFSYKSSMCKFGIAMCDTRQRNTEKDAEKQ